MSTEILNQVKVLVIPKRTNAEIVAIDATAEEGSIYYDMTNHKLMFVKNGGASETITSA